LWRDLAGSLRAPEFWALSSWLDIVVRYRQSRLGLLWVLAPSVAYIWGLGAFFASMQSRPLGAFVAHLGVGYCVFRLVQMTLIEATGAFPAASSFILDGHVRLTDFVLRVLAKSLFYFAMSLPALAVALAIAPDLDLRGLALAVVTLPVVMANALWIGVVFSLVGSRFPDLGQLVNTIFMFGFLLTPIIWDAAAMPPDSLRGMVVRFNPLFHMVELVRAPILGLPVEPFTVGFVAAMSVLGWALAALVYRRYARFVPLWV
jgi:ABC-type polysaccharide/polyol phosphate export permease